MHSSEEKVNVTTTSNDREYHEAKNLNSEILKPNGNPMCSDNAPESNIEQRRSSTISVGNSQERDESSSASRLRKRASTISFKVEAATLVREASLEIESPEVVVSSCSTSPISEVEEGSADEVIVNPEAEQASYTLTRKRAKSGIDSLIKKSANSALKRSVKVNPNVVVLDLDEAIGNENLSPVPRVSTISRYRNTFSWNRGRSVTRQSFAGKSKDNFLSFHNISYTVQQRKFFRALGPKVILKNVRCVIKHQCLNNNYLTKNCMYIFSGIMHAGVNAIMGPSGSGKTSLLDIISGRKENRGVTGSVVINGELIPENFRCASGYVTQVNPVL